MTNGYTIKFDYINSFPFGMGISLIDEDGEEINKYTFDLCGNQQAEVREALRTLYKPFRNNMESGPTEEENSKIPQCIIKQAEQCIEEWKKTFEIQL